jgi:hypothetical protein
VSAGPLTPSIAKATVDGERPTEAEPREKHQAQGCERIATLRGVDDFHEHDITIAR